MQVRVRYAPSPTGLQHVGSVRTALVNYLFARANGGVFILRLEDTDRTRYSDEYVRNLYDTFKWLGFYWDEGPDVGGPHAPYVQSERLPLYQERARELVEAGTAYYCFCGEERLAKMRAEQEDSDTSDMGYDRHCRNIAPEEAAARVALGEKAVIRLKIPLEGTTKFHDALLGDIEWKNEDVSPDPVIQKSDGFPTYHLANVVDDHLMRITHVLRAQEWIPSAPMHIIMYSAFGWTPPELIHLPMVLGPDGHKLSKRHGATAVDEFRKAGYLPEALINYVSHLGCSFEDGRDIFPLKDLERLFKIERLNKAPATFDYQKLEWYNGQYIRMKADEELRDLVMPYLVQAGLVAKEPNDAAMALVLGAMPLVKERLRFLTDAPIMMRYLFEEPPLPPSAEFIPKKLDKARTAELLAADGELLRSCDLSDLAATEAGYRAEAERLGAKFGDLMMPLRVAVTGSRVSPPLFESIRLIGIPKAIERVGRALEILKD
ncbi:MAG: glutamate--tRNA ligase [Rectinemataceae bacterium]|jgi:glutamyl-tRNA synthetase